MIAQQWLSRFSWIALGVAVLVGVILPVILTKRRAAHSKTGDEEHLAHLTR